MLQMTPQMPTAPTSETAPAPGFNAPAAGEPPGLGSSLAAMLPNMPSRQDMLATAAEHAGRSMSSI
jgi:hypothetical protein